MLLLLLHLLYNTCQFTEVVTELTVDQVCSERLRVPDVYNAHAYFADVCALTNNLLKITKNTCGFDAVAYIHSFHSLHPLIPSIHSFHTSVHASIPFHSKANSKQSKVQNKARLRTMQK